MLTEPGPTEFQYRPNLRYLKLQYTKSATPLEWVPYDGLPLNAAGASNGDAVTVTIEGGRFEMCVLSQSVVRDVQERYTAQHTPLGYSAALCNEAPWPDSRVLIKGTLTPIEGQDVIAVELNSHDWMSISCSGAEIAEATAAELVAHVEAAMGPSAAAERHSGSSAVDMQAGRGGADPATTALAALTAFEREGCAMQQLSMRVRQRSNGEVELLMANWDVPGSASQPLQAFPEDEAGIKARASHPMGVSTAMDLASLCTWSCRVGGRYAGDSQGDG